MMNNAERWIVSAICTDTNKATDHHLKKNQWKTHEEIAKYYQWLNNNNHDDTKEKSMTEWGTITKNKLLFFLYLFHR